MPQMPGTRRKFGRLFGQLFGRTFGRLFGIVWSIVQSDFWSLLWSFVRKYFWLPGLFAYPNFPYLPTHRYIEKIVKVHFLNLTTVKLGVAMSS